MAWSRARARRGRERDQRGAAAVEFGLVAVPLLLLLIGIIQFSLWFWAYQVGSHAVREGARYAAVNPCDGAGAQDRIEEHLGAAPDGTPVIPPPSFAPATEVGAEVTVSASYEVYEVGLVPVPAITKSATARVEHVPAEGCP